MVQDHAPSELKIFYAVTCSVLGIRASTSFCKSGSKDKGRFKEFIWGHHKLLRHTFKSYESPYKDTCIISTDFMLIFESYVSFTETVLASDELTSPISNSKKGRNVNFGFDEEQEDGK